MNATEALQAVERWARQLTSASMDTASSHAALLGRLPYVGRKIDAKRCHTTISWDLGVRIGVPLSGGIMEIYTSKEYAEKLEVSEIWIRELARKGRIYLARKVGRKWVYFGNSTVIRPPERWKRKPLKMRLPREELTTRQLVQHMRDAIWREEW